MENAVCHFVFYNGPRKGEAEIFTTARTSIGRAANCDFRLEAFQLDQVAPHHAEVLLEEGTNYCLYDLGTKSGTFVNGERVYERCMLMNEDYIRFGEDGPELIFRIGQPTSGRQSVPEIVPVTAELEFFSGSDAGRIYPINAAATSNVGRRADLEVPLDPRGDMIVSGNHCNIRYVNGHFVLTDTSRNGTYVNGELVDQPMEILDADVIMLGDGGPQARFHVDDAGRRYPNQRPLSPVAKTQPASSSSFKSATPPDVLASAKPFASGSASLVKPPEPPPPDAELSPEAEEVNAEAAAADPALQSEQPQPEVTDMSEADTPQGIDAVSDSTLAEASAEAHADAAHAIDADADMDPIPGSDSPVAAAPAPRKTANPLAELPFTRKQMMIAGGALALLVLLIVIFSVTGDGPESGGGAQGNYAVAMQNLNPIENSDGAFAVNAPASWNNLNRENYISIESPDKELAIDFMRDPRANETQLREILANNGADVSDRQEQTFDGRTVVTMQSSVGSVRRAGSLILTDDAPVMTIMEASEAAMARLSEQERNRLLVANVTISGPMPGAAPQQAQLPAPVASPTPTPANTAVTTAAAPTPDAGTSAAPETPAQPPAGATSPTSADGTPAPATQTPPPAQAAAATPDDTPSTGGATIESAALSLTLTAPASWTGASEEDDEMIMLADGTGLVVRIARDPGDLDADATFEAMEDQEWTRRDVQKGSNFTAGEFRNNGQNLLLILIPEQAKTTLLIYCTSPEEFTRPQRVAIKDIMVQLLPQ